MKLSRWLLLSFIGLGLLIQSVYAADPEPAGKVGYVRGVVSAKSQTGGSRFLSKNKPIFETDSIVTGATSFVVLAFKDGTKMTIRPNSVFIIKSYQFKNSKNDKASFRLLKGGLRSVTGKMNKNKAEKMKITTPVATIGIRGTDFIARLCDGDCATKKGIKNKNTIARVALAKGIVQIKDEKGTRKAKTGDRLKTKDTLLTDKKGFAVLVFDDNTRVTVQPASELNIAEYIFPKGRPKQGKVLLSLAKGGARTLTGRIGKANPKDFKLKTPSATMGIRGTGFDTQYNGQTYVNVWQGGVVANQGGQSQNIGLNQTFQIGNSGFNQLPQMPLNIVAQFKNTPRPDKAKTQSIWVSVKNGKVTLTKNKTDDSKGGAVKGVSSGNKKNGNKGSSTKTKGKDNKKDDSDNKDDSESQDDSDSNNEEGNQDSDAGDSGGSGDADGGEETIEIAAGETAVATDADSGKVESPPNFIANDPYTAVAPGNVEATSDVFGQPGKDNTSCTVN